MAETKTPRITKAQRFEDIISLLNGETPKYGTTTDKAVEVMAHEMELLAKKNASGGEGKKLTKTQEENEVHKKRILGMFEGYEGEGMTCSEIIKAIPKFQELNFQTQRVAPMCNALWKDGKLDRVEGKGGKALFKPVA